MFSIKILYLSPTYYPHVGGVEYVVKSIAERLARRGYSVTVVAGEPEIKESREEEVNGVRVIRWPTMSPGGAYHLPRSRNKLKLLLKSELFDTDVVHIHSVHSMFSVWSGLKVKREFNYKGRLIITPHYHGTGHTLIRRTLWIPWKKFVKRLLATANIIHTVSKTEANLIEKHYGFKTVTIEHGVEEWLLDMGWEPRGYAMYSGRIEKYKNINRLARIVKILNEKYGYNLELRIYGEGPYKAKLEKYLKRTGVPYKLEGFQPYEKYIEALSHAEFFALLSEKESFGQSANEANALGVPVVAALPWAINFDERTRTLAVELSSTDEHIAEKVARFLKEALEQPRPAVASWSQVLRKYVTILYHNS